MSDIGACECLTHFFAPVCALAMIRKPLWQVLLQKAFEQTLAPRRWTIRLDRIVVQPYVFPDEVRHNIAVIAQKAHGKKGAG